MREHRSEGGMAVVATHVPIRMKEAMLLQFPKRYPCPHCLGFLELWFGFRVGVCVLVVWGKVERGSFSGMARKGKMRRGYASGLILCGLKMHLL